MNRSESAFTLIEVLVSLALFSVVMLVGVGALLTVIDANAKAQATQSVMNNLNVAIDGMMRSVRMGSHYHCDSGNISSWPLTPRDCPNGSSGISFVTYNGNLRRYYLKDNRIYRYACTSGSGQCADLPITSPDIDIKKFDVYVAGAERTYADSPPDLVQPVAVFVIEGQAGSERISSSLYGKKKRIRTDFKLQTVATQRLLDL